MRLLYPWCFFVILLIPILLLIYILRSHYTEHTVNSTYIWTLSERFKKRRNPLSGITGIISLLLQLLFIFIIIIALVSPIFILRNRASEYCFVLDASESMNMESEGKTRFERAKDEIEEIISSSKKGSEYTLIYASGEASTIYGGVKDKDSAIERLNELKPSYVENTTETLRGVAQDFFSEKPGAKIYILTDKNYQKTQNVNVINVSKNETNFGITSLECKTIVEANGDVMLYADGKISSYKDAGDLTLKLFVDGSEQAMAEQKIQIGANKRDEAFSFSVKLNTPSFSSARVIISNSDSLLNDNEAIHYNVKNDKQYKTIIVSKTPFFFQAVIDAVGDYDVLAVEPEEYEHIYKDKSYGLYIFDSYTPERLPESGTVWMINSQRNIEKTGFNYRSEVVLDGYEMLDKSESTKTDIADILENVKGNDLYVSRYLRYSTYNDYMTLFSCDGVPLIMAGENSYGNRMVVFAFSLHDSDLVMTTDFIVLMGNLLKYSFPDVLDKTIYTAGQGLKEPSESVSINTAANIDSVKLISPSGEVKYLDTSETTNTIVPDEVGTYLVEVTEGGVTHEHRFYSIAPTNECVPSVQEAIFILAGEPSNDRLDSEFDPSIIIFILLILVFAADWVVYMYEKRQLR